MELIDNSIIEIILVIITSVISFASIKLKILFEENLKDETVKNIVVDTVKYIEQITRDISVTSENKKQKAKAKTLEWLKEKKIKLVIPNLIF